MGARLVIERVKTLESRKKLSKAYCDTIDYVLMDTDASQTVFETVIEAVETTISQLGNPAGLDRRTAKTRDMRDTLRRILTS
jgi:hypothetical protein